MKEKLNIKELKDRFIEILKDKSCSRVCFDLSAIDWAELRRRIIEILTDKRGELGIPKDKAEAIAEMILPDIIAFFQSEEGKKVFAEWKKEQDDKEKRIKNITTGEDDE